RHLRAAAEPAHLEERDRRRQNREDDDLESAGSAEVRVAAELRAGEGLRRSARALEGTGGGHDRVGTHRAQQRRAPLRRAAQDGADAARLADRRRRRGVERCEKGEDAVDGANRSRQRDEVATSGRLTASRAGTKATKSTKITK